MNDHQCMNMEQSSTSDADCQRKMDSTTRLPQASTILSHSARSSDMSAETFGKAAVFAAEDSSWRIENSGAHGGIETDSLLKVHSVTANSGIDFDQSSLANDFFGHVIRMHVTLADTNLDSIHDRESEFQKRIHLDGHPMTLSQDPLTPTTMENDTCDTQRQPLHAEVTWVNEVPASSQNEIFGENSSFVGENSDPKKASSPSRPRLTLSAFRRPENTVRIADLDASRKITTEYDFASSRILGHGASSTVRLAVRRKDGVNVAVKTIAKHEALRIRRMRHGARRHLDEWEVLQSLRDNPHVVTLLDVFETDEEIQLVMEYCEGGELFDVIQRKRNQALSSPDKAYRYSESKAARIVSQMLSVLVELHSRGVVHRDVKPENILLTSDSEMCAKLSDFGTSRELHPEEESDSCSSDGEASPLTPQSRKRAYSAVGSNFYAAPEVRSGEGYGTAVDVYSLGVTLYVLLCGFPPSFTTNEEDDVVAFPSFSHLSEDVRRLIRKMVDPDASRRITAKDALQDEWIVRHTRSPTLHMPARRTILSPSAPRPVVDMELVCSRLFNGLDSSSSDENEARVLKRRKVKDDFCLSMADLYKGVASASASAEAGVYCDGLSMADLYKGVASAAASAEAAAAGVYCDGLSMADLYKGVASAAASAEAAAAGVYSVGDCICVMEDEEEGRVTSPFEASFTALSV